MQVSKISTHHTSFGNNPNSAEEDKSAKFVFNGRDKRSLTYFSLAGVGIYLANDIPKIKHKLPLAKAGYLTGSVIKGTGAALILTLILKTLGHLYRGDFKKENKADLSH